MEKVTFLNELKELVENQDVMAVSRNVNELRTRFDDFLLEEDRKKQVAVLEARERGEKAEFEQEIDPIRNEFFEIYSAFKAKKSEVVAEKKSIQNEFLKQKRALISRLKTVVESEENIGAAFGEFKTIHEEWKKVGDIPREKRDEVQAEYSRLLEDFFYNMKIYRELQDHDLHRNQQVKEEVIQKLIELVEDTSIQTVEKNIKVLQNEWAETGPVSKDKWEDLKNKYNEIVQKIYERIHAHYEEKRQTQKDNLEKKQILVEKSKEVVAKIETANNTKAWENLTAEILEIQAIWKTVGFGPKRENEEIWKAFRSECDFFFEKKKAFYTIIKDEYDAVAETKQKIVDQAEALKTSTDWKATTEKLIQLQKKWKSVGSAGQKNEQRLWKTFRAACDEFFNAKSAFYAEKEKEFEGNLTIKQTLIEKIAGFELPKDKTEALETLKKFSNEFNAIGHVPITEKDKVFKAFKTAIDAKYEQLNIEGQEKEKIMFEARIETLKASPNAVKLLAKEKVELRKQIDELKSNVTQYENNLGFFSNAKKANPLIQDVEKKINQSKIKIEEIKRKLQLIPNE
ncbi:MAG: DUF349 domain-containing protein [Crocinitomicaceae bacterium]